MLSFFATGDSRNFGANINGSNPHYIQINARKINKRSHMRQKISYRTLSILAVRAFLSVICMLGHVKQSSRKKGVFGDNSG